MDSTNFVSRSIGWVWMAPALTGILFVGCGPTIPDTVRNAAENIPEEISYNLHVKPILSDRCFSCHGPDPNTREAGLRLDTEEGAYQTLQDRWMKKAVSPGKPGSSELFHRILAEDPELRMPPPESNLSLSDQEKALLIRWIEQGAEYQDHWAYLPPEKVPLPVPKNTSSAKNEVDAFVFSRLDREGLEPSPEAPAHTLIRRLAFDLTGLPPDWEMVERFVNDPSPNAYENLVDELLASDAYAERMALDWLDVARYADSHGLHADGIRMMWPWRDWVIGAFRSNMPYDQFIQWQIAGDMMPGSKKDQVLATAFNRNHQMTAEGGIIDEEYRLEYVFDRSETTAKAFLGLTMECAKCHDHKFDPLSQRDYFSLAAFYNNVDEVGMTGDDKNAGPMMLFTDGKTDQEIDRIKKKISELESRQQAALTDPVAVTSKNLPSTTLQKGLVAHFPLASHENEMTLSADKALEARVSGSPEPVTGPLPGQGALRFKEDYDIIEIPATGLFEMDQPFSYSIWINPETVEPYRFILGNIGNKNTYWRGYELYLDSLNRINVQLIHALPHNAIHVSSDQRLPTNEWTHVAFTYDGSGKASGLRVFINGQQSKGQVEKDNLYKSILPVNTSYTVVDKALRLARSYRVFSGDDGIYTGSLADLKIYKRALTDWEVAGLFSEEAGKAPEDQAAALTYTNYWENPDLAVLADSLAFWRQKKLKLMGEIEEVMVMQERPVPRKTFLLERGAYDAPAEEVEAAVPEVLSGFSPDWPKNRLGLAKWLTSPKNPLVARVTVNRYWYRIFGRGIVPTVDDFGSQGQLPSHPELLDWLAVDFMENGWDVKQLLKKMVMSATYRQSSEPTELLLERDPDNVLLARGARHRLQGEFIRDNYLKASGLLVKQVGGPSVKPYQPPGIWEEKGEFSYFLYNYRQDSGANLYRRSMYTFIRRTAPPPAMTTFDVPNREECLVSRQETNTPLQPLVLMNDPQVTEAARVMAEKMLQAGDLEQQLVAGVRNSLGRDPKREEVEVLKSMYTSELKRFETDPAAARELLAVGEYPANARIPAEKTAAMTMVASLLFNHYEFYTKK
ncbi:DUF1553 domain-containing protein [Cyclobacterium xiamenense]|uniref:DUF1553 domain-containing protein n=1 Tax=Cyclobacterium xiamenense TaxID=1297121 RepID=UPI001F50B534|nr:DUF1553 domain-containing protein [Cyclobacterium xiamenense]